MAFNNVFWITGLSGAGKTTVSLILRDKLVDAGILPVIVDGDSFREVLGGRFGSSEEERLYLAGCYSRLCKLLVEQDHTVICSTISMFDSVREWNRQNIKNYIEVYLKSSPETLQKRDPKGLYSKALLNIDTDLVGFQQKFQEPKNSDLIFNVDVPISVEEVATKILDYAKKLRAES
jgi:cytidine diphosphoramidate kinase